jgi:hypothetical protein
MLSFLAFPFPFIKELGSWIALMMLLPLAFLECPPLLVALSFSCLFGMDMLLTLAFLLWLIDPVFEAVPLAIGRALAKVLDFPEPACSTEGVSGVELAIVPPTPVLPVEDCTFKGAFDTLFPVMEQVEGGTVDVGLISAGLCGDGIPIMNGILLDDALLAFR